MALDAGARSATETINRLLTRAWTALRPPQAPDYAPDRIDEVPADPRVEWLAQLARTQYALEQAKVALLRDGWTSGTWFREQQTCLVGALVRMADDPDQVPTVADAWHCVDELYEAVHESRDHHSSPPGLAYPHGERRARLRGLTAWNDERGRTREQVVDVVDRAIARTIVASCR